MMMHTVTRLAAVAVSLGFCFVVFAMPAAGQDVMIRSNQTVVISSSIVTSGDIIIESLSGDVNLNAAVTSTGGHILLLAAHSVLQSDAGHVSTIGGIIDIVAGNDIDLAGTVSSDGGDVTFVSDANENSDGTITVTGQITTGGGDLSSSSHAFVMTAQGGANNGNIDTDGGHLSIFSWNTIDISASTIESGNPAHGGNIEIIAGNISSADFGLAIQDVDLNSWSGSGGASSIGGGVNIQGTTSLTVGQGYIVLDGGALDLIVDGGTISFDGHDGLVSTLRDVQVINGGTIETRNGYDLVVKADSDGIENSDALGTAFGGVHVDGSSILHSSGALIITGTEWLANPTHAVVLEGATSAGGNIRIEGDAIGPAGADIVLASDVTSVAGSLSVVSSRGVDQDGILTTLSGTIDVEAQGGDITMAASTSSVSSGGNIRYVASSNATIVTLNAAPGHVSITAGGSILDANGANVNITASEARFRAGDTVGDLATTDPIETSVNVLAAEAKSITLEEIATVSIGTVNAVTVDRVQGDGTTTPVSDAGALSGLATAGGNGAILVLTRNETLTVDRAISASGFLGNIRLKAENGGAIAVNADVASSAGHVYVLAAGGIQQVEDISTGGAGTILVVANGGNLLTQDGATATSGGGDIFYATMGNMEVVSVNAGTGTVFLLAGSMADAGDTDYDVIASGLYAESLSGSVGASWDGIDIQVTTLAVDSAADIYIENTGALAVDAVGPSSLFSVNADGTASPFFSYSGEDLTGKSIILQAGSTLTLNEGGDLDGLGLQASGAGNVLLQTRGSGDIDINAAMVTDSGSISVLAHGSVEQGSGGNIVTIGGSIDVQSGTAGIVASDGATADSGGGNIRYSAPDVILVTGIDAGSGDVSVTAGNSILDNGDANQDVSGNGVRLVATSDWIGETYNKLDTWASRLTATAEEGIYIGNTGAVVIDDVGPVFVNRVQMDGSTISVGDAALSDVVTIGYGSIVLVATDTITVNDGTVIPNGIGVSANTSGNVLLQTMGSGDINANADVATGTGSISLLAAGGLNQTSWSDMRTAGPGTIDLEASTGGFSMWDGSAVTSAGGNILMVAANNVIVAGIHAESGSVQIRSVAGSIEDGGDADQPDITAGTASMVVGNRAGSSSDTLDLGVDELAAEAGAGGIFVDNQNAVAVVNAPAVVVNRVGMDGTTSAHVGQSVNGLSTSADGAIVTFAHWGDLSVDAAVHAGGVGNVLLQARGTGNNAAVNAVVSSGSGNISVLAPQSVTQNAAGDIATGGGDILVTAERGGVTMANGATAASGGGSIIYTSGVYMVVGLLDAGVGSVGLAAGHDILDANGANNNVVADDLVAVAGGEIAYPGDALEVDVAQLLYQGTATFVSNARPGQFVFPLLVTADQVASDATTFPVVVGISGGGGDFDGDGIPSGWETANNLNPAMPNGPSDNADGDWMTDYEEYIADTRPTDPTSHFPPVSLIPSPSGTMALIVDPTSTARVYGVRRAPDLLVNPQVWTPHSQEKTGTGATLIFTVTNNVSGPGYYRTGVRLP